MLSNPCQKRYWKGYWFDIYLELKKKKNSPPYMMYKTQSNILWILPIFRLFFLCTQLGWHLYIIYKFQQKLFEWKMEQPLGNKFISPFTTFFRFYYIDNKVIIIKLMNHSLCVIFLLMGGTPPAIMTSICNIN